MSAIKTFNALSPSTWSMNGLLLETYREKQLGICTSTHHLNKMFKSETFSNCIYEFSLALYYEICTLPLRLPLINFITYIAYSVIFQADLNQKYQEALNEGNLQGAFVLIERGADITYKNKEKKALVDLFLDNFSRVEPSKEDIEMVHQLIEKGAFFDKKHPGFSRLFEKADKLNLTTIILSLLKKEIFPNLEPLIITNIRQAQAKAEVEINQNLWCFDRDITQLIDDLNNGRHPLLIIKSEKEKSAFINALWKKEFHRFERIDMNNFIIKKNEVTYVETNKLQDKVFRLSKIENKNTILILDNLHSASMTFPIFKEHFLDKIYVSYFAIESKKPKSDEIFTPKFIDSSNSDESLISLYDNRSQIEQVINKPIPREVYIAAIDYASRYFSLKPYAITAFELIKAANFKLESQEKNGSFLLQAKRTELAKLEHEHALLLIKKPDSTELTNVRKKYKIISKDIKDLEKEHAEYCDNLTEMKKLESLSAYLIRFKGPDIQDLSHKVRDKMEQIKKKINSLPSYKTAIDTSLIAMVVAEKTKLPIDDIGQNEKEKLLKLEAEMNQEIIGQEKAIKAVTEVILSARLGMKQKNRPVGVFLCVGPTGVGKTSLAKLLAKKIMGCEEKLIRINMELYSEKHTVTNLIGSPLGYKDHDKGAAWLDELKQNPRSVILLDEIEKAHPNVKQVFLSAFDEGFFIDNENKEVNCSEAIFILTSNAGAREIQSHGNTPRGWFEKEEETLDIVVDRAISHEFKPEFINRIDKVIIFNKLDNPDVAKKIIIHELNLFKAVVEGAQELTLTYTDRLITYLAEKGFNPKMGARPLKRIIESTIRPLCTRAILEGKISRGDTASLDVTEEGNFILTKIGK